MDINEVTGMSFVDPTRLLIETRHLGAVHAHLPKIIVENEHMVTKIDNPDDDLHSILRYLTGGQL